MKSGQLLLLMLLFLLAEAYPVLSQQVIFNSVLPPEGKTFEHVTSIVQDKQGYMWFASKKGLYRFDGYTMTAYKNNPLNSNSLVSNFLECVYADSDGMIWIGALGAGLDRFDPVTGTFTHFHHNAANPASLSNDTVTTILQDHQGTLWIGTHGGLDRFIPETGTFIHFRHQTNDSSSISNNQVRALYEDRQGTLWIGTGSPFADNGGGPEDGGLNRMNKQTDKFTRYLHNPNDPHSLVNNKVRAIFEDSKGNFWIGTGGDGLHTMDRTKGIFQHYFYDPAHPDKLSRPPIKKEAAPYDHITFIREDVTGALWIGTAAAGLSRYDTKTQKITHYESDKDSTGTFFGNAWAAYASKDDILWISNMRGKLYRIDPSQKNIPHYALKGGNVNSLFQENNGILWIGTDQGLVQMNQRNGIIRQFVNDPKNTTSLSDNFVFSIKEDRQGAIWVTTNNGGLNLFNKENGTFIRYQHDPKNHNSLSDDFVIPVYEDKESNFWVGTATGLNKMNRKTGVFINYPPYPGDVTRTNRNLITAILEDGQGKLWAGSWSGGGVHQFNKENGKFKSYLKGISIISIYEDDDGILWIGGSDGLYQYNRNSDAFYRFADLSSLTGIPDVISITEDNQKNLWLGTMEGIIRLNPQRNETSLYGKDYGVDGDRLIYTSCYKGNGGELFFGDTTGYFAFFPDQLTKNSKPPQILFSNFHLGNQLIIPGKHSLLPQPLSELKELQLHYNQNVFSIDFAAIDYSNPERNRQLFMLENYDNSWRQAGLERRAYYFNVPPGKYVFRVKGANSDGIWAEKNISIIITPPWWRTWWAYGLYGLLFIAGVLAIHRFQKRRIIHQERERIREKELAQAREIEKAYNELKRTQAQLIQSEKMASLGELTAGIAHEIQNPLNFVNNFSEVNKELIQELKQEQKKELRNPGNENEILNNIEQNIEKIFYHGKRAGAIVKGMLQHSRKSTGQKELTDINALADEYLRLSYQTMRSKDKSFNAALQTDFDEGIGKISIIPQDIGRVLLNLFNNAFYSVHEKKRLKSEDYEPMISVSTKKLNNKVEICIKDNGLGIPEKIVDKIFQPFFTTKPTGEGTGLGLSLSYDIIKAHGAELKVNTKEGEGAEFIIQLPV